MPIPRGRAATSSGISAGQPWAGNHTSSSRSHFFPSVTLPPDTSYSQSNLFSLVALLPLGHTSSSQSHFFLSATLTARLTAADPCSAPAAADADSCSDPATAAADSCSAPTIDAAPVADSPASATAADADRLPTLGRGTDHLTLCLGGRRAAGARFPRDGGGGRGPAGE